MNRTVLAIILFIAFAPVARAQDMPLSQILIENEGWRKAPNPGPPPQPFPEELAGTRTAENQRATAYHVRSSDGTLFVGYGASHAVWAFQLDKDRKPSSGAPYCPLRSETRKATARVGAICLDDDGRIYASTPIGIQIFDPTGRLCGVVRAPDGAVHMLMFEDNHLVAWVGETKHVRKLKTTGTAK